MQNLNKNEISWLSDETCVERLKKRSIMTSPFLVYSSLLGGWTDSSLGLLVGLDDHGFHRGDGVFEALRVINGKPYLLKEHWERMQNSMRQIDIKIDLDFNSVQAVIEKGLERFSESDGIIRLFVTRGPGGFAADVRECIAPQFFCVIVRFKPQAEERFEKGVRIGRSPVPVKPGWLATTKSLNYLLNVMMKKDSVERNLDFTVAFDENAHVAESATENLMVITRDGYLTHPKLSRILKGCTLMKVFEIVEREKLIPTRRDADLTEQDLLDAQALFVVGTTLDVLPVCEYDGKKIALSTWGPKLRDIVRRDQGLI